jgi:hypothetical protein
MPEWTTPEDVRGRWTSAKPLNIDDEKLSLLLEDAEDLATREFSDIQTRIDGGSLPLNRVKRVIARVVIRHLRNPDGLRQAMDTTGPYTTQVMHGGDEPGEMYLSEEDRADLGESRTGRAFTIDTTPPLPSVYGYGPEGWLNYGGTWYE